jgi:hypothetical protein
MSVLLGHPPSIRYGIKNHCVQLEVGREYEMRREHRVPDILSIDGSRIALAVEGSSQATETRAFATHHCPLRRSSLLAIRTEHPYYSARKTPRLTF